MAKIIDYLIDIGIVIVIAFLIFGAGFYFGSHPNGKSISSLTNELAKCQGQLTITADKLANAQAELKRGTSANQSAINTTGQIQAINGASAAGLDGAINSNKNCTEGLDGCLSILQEAGKRNPVAKN